ncbi:MAG TPA: precorrin-2 C(20)-methyltransferase [Nitrospiraceae bacterium]|nr:precorrin-2 C(20)-methyltransferase [Nitrospiraceae bacterium]
MTGTLYVIGVGPGDPDLLTLKAVRILGNVPCLCVPKGREEGSSVALSIVKGVINLDNKEIIEAHFPMRKTKDSGHGSELDTKWNETAETVLRRLKRGIDVAFITLGDPTVYSTFFYLYDKLFYLDPVLSIEIIPGVSSINASASRAGISLGLADEKIAIIPMTYVKELKKVLEDFDTLVLMKVHTVFHEIMRTLEETGLVEKATYIVRAGMKGEKVFRNLREVREEDLDYFSMVIVRKAVIAPVRDRVRTQLI